MRATENIKKGQEITIANLRKHDPFAGFRNRKHRQKTLLENCSFLCACDLCKGEKDIDASDFETVIKEAEELSRKRIKSNDHGVGSPLACQFYSREDCRKEINCYKKMYKDGKIKKIQPIFLYRLIERAFDTATFGYLLYKTTDLKMEAETFAKAADKFGKILGYEVVNENDSKRWKKRYKNFQNWAQVSGGYAANSFQCLRIFE